MVNDYRPYSGYKDKTSLGSNEGEIVVIGILYFLKSAYKTLLIFGVGGVVLAIAYLVITPNQYEAAAQIAMAQISIANSSNNINNNPLGVNIREPSLLIARLSLPTNFTAQEVSACGMHECADSGAVLSKSIKLRVPKGVANVVELLRPIYTKTVAYGHFGRDEQEFSWEAIDKAAALKAEL